MSTLLTPIRPALPSFDVTGPELRLLVAVARQSTGSGGAPLAADVEDDGLGDALVARGLLRRAGGEALVLPDGPLGGAIEVMASSHVQLHVRHIAKPAPTSSWFALTPVVGVELRERDASHERTGDHAPGRAGSWSADAFPTRDLFARMAALVNLEDREPPTVDDFETTGALLEQCADHLALGDRAAAEEALCAAGAGEISVRAFLGAFERRMATNATVRSSSPVAGSPSAVFAWLDADDWGLWRVPLPDPASTDPVAVGSLTAFAVCVAWANLLPVGDDPGWRGVLLPFGPPD